MKNKKLIDSHLQQAEKLIWDEIDRKIRAILVRKDNPAGCFICAMGVYFFLDKKGDQIDDGRKWMDSVFTIFEEYNEIFKLSGAGVRWDLDSHTGVVTKRNDW